MGNEEEWVMARSRQTHASSRARRRKAEPEAEFLRPIAERLNDMDSLREGTIVLHFPEGESAYLHCKRGAVEIAEGAPTEYPPLIEVFGDRKRIQAILEGEKDARMQFLAGGLRLRGDLGYFSELAVEMGILREPL
jgi:hypothetical protein